jgi:2-oxoglutarate ferredoxin oxidoreductase subunit alpha
MTSDAKMIVVAYGTAARIAKGAVKRVRSNGLPVGSSGPSPWALPGRGLANITKKAKAVLVFEMTPADDRRRAARHERRIDCEFYGRPGGVVAAPRRSPASSSGTGCRGALMKKVSVGPGA